jgi:hypothetical protein
MRGVFWQLYKTNHALAGGGINDSGTCTLGKSAVLSVTTFWSFQRELSRRTGRNVLNAIQLIDLPDPGTKLGPWKPKHARRRHMTTVSRNSFVQHKT